jgi:hypothetical protein
VRLKEDCSVLVVGGVAAPAEALTVLPAAPPPCRYHPKAANTSGYDCVLAYSSYRYNTFLGNGSTASQCDPASYATASLDLDRR